MGVLRLDTRAFRALSVGVQELEPPDTYIVRAAHGWLELGCAAEARAELAQLSPLWRNHPAVLEVRWLLCAQDKCWEEAVTLARAEQDADPRSPAGWLHLAYALRRMDGGGLALAREILLPAVERFPAEPVIPYNLACYACQLERLDEARLWLQHALVAGEPKEILKMALADEDLQPLWPEIRQMD